MATKMTPQLLQQLAKAGVNVEDTSVVQQVSQNLSAPNGPQSLASRERMNGVVSTDEAVAEESKVPGLISPQHTKNRDGIRGQFGVSDAAGPQGEPVEVQNANESLADKALDLRNPLSGAPRPQPGAAPAEEEKEEFKPKSPFDMTMQPNPYK